MSDETETVWIKSAGRSGQVEYYHTNRDCLSAKMANSIDEIDLSEALDRGLKECSQPHCGDARSTDHIDTDSLFDAQADLREAAEDPSASQADPDRVSRPSPMFGGLDGGKD